MASSTGGVLANSLGWMKLHGLPSTAAVRVVPCLPVPIMSVLVVSSSSPGLSLVFSPISLLSCSIAQDGEDVSNVIGTPRAIPPRLGNDTVQHHG